MTIRVLRIIHDLQVGGVQRMLLKTLRALRELGVEAEVACVAKRGDLADQFVKEGFPVHVLGFKSRLDPRGLWRLRRLANQGGFDVVHSHMYASNMAANYALMGLKKPAIVNSYHSTIPVRGRGQAANARRTRNIPAAFIAVSEAVKAPVLATGIPENKVTIIYNGVQVRPEPLPLPEPSVDRAFELVWMGRFVKEKNHVFLVKVMAACREAGVNARLTLVGDGPKLQSIRDLVKDLKLEEWVRLPGVTDDVFQYLGKADLYVTASQREGFANALIEACSAGRAIFASGIDPHTELLNGTEAGEIIPDDPKAWAQRIGEIAQDRPKLEAMSAEAFKLAEKYSLKRTAEDTVALYHRIAKK